MLHHPLKVSMAVYIYASTRWARIERVEKYVMFDLLGSVIVFGILWKGVRV